MSTPSADKPLPAKAHYFELAESELNTIADHEPVLPRSLISFPGLRASSCTEWASP